MFAMLNKFAYGEPPSQDAAIEAVGEIRRRLTRKPKAIDEPNSDVSLLFSEFDAAPIDILFNAQVELKKPEYAFCMQMTIVERVYTALDEAFDIWEREQVRRFVVLIVDFVCRGNMQAVEKYAPHIVDGVV